MLEIDKQRVEQRNGEGKTERQGKLKSQRKLKEREGDRQTERKYI